MVLPRCCAPPREQAVGDKQLVAVVTFLGDPTVAEAQYLDATPTPQSAAPLTLVRAAAPTGPLVSR